ncbi:hypothetical protein DS2_09137 [Catenovulum agarivorans DS-2]|uniref:Solute-binding protein family 3/N-terminal domain-containing protein n=1 Tax=Catenovulum agarivorans DS-2 TaxID=1328313 RepID=W7QEA1_9ALTE|nr:hypothetical protein [Catenovulum agarivorans]EWH10251.1 hypothetical protein DS2_09137 [Catenovulum agarivorans DS-2]
MLKSFLMVLLLYCLPHWQAIAQLNHSNVISIKAGIFVETFKKYPHFMQSDICQQALDISQMQIDRTLLDAILMCRAFEHQNTRLQIEFVSMPNERRGMLLVEQGKMDTMTSSVWSTETNGADVYVTQPLLDVGEFEKGVYFAMSHPVFDLPPQQVALSNYTGLSVKDWTLDNQALYQLTTQYIKVGYSPAIFQYMRKGRADFILLEFPSSYNLNWCHDEVCLKPLPNVKVALNGTRHLVVSKYSENGAQFFYRLERGLTQLRAMGEIRKLYQQSGLINSQVEDWKVLN